MNILINYADRRFYAAQELNSRTGLEVGGFDKVISYRRSDLDPGFLSKNERIFRARIGAGYWLWKPYIIHQALMNARDGDFIFYFDSGGYFVNPITPIIACAHNHNLDVVIIDYGAAERLYTKRDAFILMDCAYEDYAHTHQRIASYMVFRKSKFSIEFTTQFLEYAQDPRILTDLPNKMGQPNAPDFIAHRHDQSIFSLLTKKYAIKVVSENVNWIRNGWNPNCSQIFNHTRAADPKFPLGIGN